MSDDTKSIDDLLVGPSPHVHDTTLSTRSVMAYVLIGLAPVVVAAIWFFGLMAIKQLVIITAACLAFEWLFTRMRGRRASLDDCSAAVTGVILALSLPGNAPWYIGVIAAMIAIGLGKVVFGGLGMNLFNPAMVGRAFVTIAFAKAMGKSGYFDVLSQATPLSWEGTDLPASRVLFLGNHNGSLGEVSVLASLVGGLYLCLKRIAAWEIPVAIILSMCAFSVLGQLLGRSLDPEATLLSLHLRIDQALFSGALVFGAFFIATDPVTNPMTRRGRVLFGILVAFFVWVIRALSGYPEGFMFAILIVNSLVPLINRLTIPKVVGQRRPVVQEAAV
ncbi:MAG: RnfABCDGE type electron transport complex subunit D [Planctomycetota bacterium]